MIIQGVRDEKDKMKELKQSSTPHTKKILHLQ